MCQQGGVLVFEIEELEELKSGPWQHFDQEVGDKRNISDASTIELVGAHWLAGFDVNWDTLVRILIPPLFYNY